MNDIINKFLNVFGTNSTTNFQLIKWCKMLKIKPFYYAMTDEINKNSQISLKRFMQL